MNSTITWEKALEKIKGEVDRLCAGDSALSRVDAYDRAIVAVVMTAAEEQCVAPFEAKLLSAMQRLHDGDRTALAFRKSEIAKELQLDGMSIDDWTLWSTLSSLEARGLVTRPRGPRSKTWSLVTTTAGPGSATREMVW